MKSICNIAGQGLAWRGEMSGPDPSALWRAAEQSKQASLKHIIWGPGKLYWLVHTCNTV